MKKVSILLLFYFVAVVNAASEWKLVDDQDEIQLYSLQKPNYGLKHYKAQTQIKKDADTILSALQDTAACHEWVYNCISNDVVAMTAVGSRIYHTIIHSPLWFKDRDFYLQSHVLYNPVEKLFTISLVSKPTYAPEIKDKVRVTQVEMIWSLKYLADGITQVTYQVYIEPKLPIKAINNKLIQKSIFQTMQGLIKIVKNPIYAKIKYSKYELEMLTDDN